MNYEPDCIYIRPGVNVKVILTDSKGKDFILANYGIAKIDPETGEENDLCFIISMPTLVAIRSGKNIRYIRIKKEVENDNID